LPMKGPWVGRGSAPWPVLSHRERAYPLPSSSIPHYGLKKGLSLTTLPAYRCLPSRTSRNGVLYQDARAQGSRGVPVRFLGVLTRIFQLATNSCTESGEPLALPRFWCCSLACLFQACFRASVASKNSLSKGRSSERAQGTCMTDLSDDARSLLARYTLQRGASYSWKEVP
jgi:hypothetical protein